MQNLNFFIFCTEKSLMRKFFEKGGGENHVFLIFIKHARTYFSNPLLHSQEFKESKIA